MKKNKNVEGMTFDELLEIEEQVKVLTRKEFKKINTEYKFLPFTSFYTISSIATISNLMINPNILNLIAGGFAITIESIILSQLIDAMKIVKNNHTNFKSIKQKSYNDYRNNLPIRQELIRLYNSLLDDLINEINKSKLDKDPLSIAILIGNYLIPQGLLSYTQKFHKLSLPILYPRNDNYYNGGQLEGMYVIAGYGCCRNTNTFIADVLNKIGIKSDKICCFESQGDKITETEIKNKILADSFRENHIIIGYIDNNRYYLIDPNLYNYSIKKGDICYLYPYSNLDDYTYNIIPIFTPNTFQNKLNWTPYLKNDYFTKNEVENKSERIRKILDEGEIKRFIDFKLNNAITFKKIAFLTQIELERNEEKENQKTKKI